MKNSLRLLFVTLAFVTTGLFAHAATAAVTPAPSSHQQIAKKGKKSGKKKHKHHHKKK